MASANRRPIWTDGTDNGARDPRVFSGARQMKLRITTHDHCGARAVRVCGRVGERGEAGKRRRRAAPERPPDREPRPGFGTARRVGRGAIRGFRVADDGPARPGAAHGRGRTRDSRSRSCAASCSPTRGSSASRPSTCASSATRPTTPPTPRRPAGPRGRRPPVEPPQVGLRAGVEPEHGARGERRDHRHGRFRYPPGPRAADRRRRRPRPERPDRRDQRRERPRHPRRRPRLRRLRQRLRDRLGGLRLLDRRREARRDRQRLPERHDDHRRDLRRRGQGRRRDQPQPRRRRRQPGPPRRDRLRVRPRGRDRRRGRERLDHRPELSGEIHPADRLGAGPLRGQGPGRDDGPVQRRQRRRGLRNRGVGRRLRRLDPGPALPRDLLDLAPEHDHARAADLPDAALRAADVVRWRHQVRLPVRDQHGRARRSPDWRR